MVEKDTPRREEGEHEIMVTMVRTDTRFPTPLQLQLSEQLSIFEQSTKTSPQSLMWFWFVENSVYFLPY